MKLMKKRYCPYMMFSRAKKSYNFHSLLGNNVIFSRKSQEFWNKRLFHSCATIRSQDQANVDEFRVFYNQKFAVSDLLCDRHVKHDKLTWEWEIEKSSNPSDHLRLPNRKACHHLEGSTLSYCELKDGSSRIAHVMAELFSFKEGHHLINLVSDSRYIAPMMMSLLGAWKLGGVVVNSPSNQSDERILEQFQVSNEVPKVLLVEIQHLDRFRYLFENHWDDLSIIIVGDELEETELLSLQPKKNEYWFHQSKTGMELYKPNHEYFPDQPFFVGFSNGESNNPIFVPLKALGTIHYLMKYHLKIEENDIVLNLLNLSGMNGFYSGILGSLVMGTTTYVTSHSSMHLFETLAEKDITKVFAPPHIYRMLAQGNVNADVKKLENIQYHQLGGRIPKKVRKFFEKELGSTIMNHFSIPEHGIILSSSHGNDIFEEKHPGFSLSFCENELCIDIDKSPLAFSCSRNTDSLFTKDEDDNYEFLGNQHDLIFHDQREINLYTIEKSLEEHEYCFSASVRLHEGRLLALVELPLDLKADYSLNRTEIKSEIFATVPIVEEIYFVDRIRDRYTEQIDRSLEIEIHGDHATYVDERTEMESFFEMKKRRESLEDFYG